DDLDHVVLREMLTSSGANALKLTPTHLDLISRSVARGCSHSVAAPSPLRGRWLQGGGSFPACSAPNWASRPSP
ncbi:hypothetical protein, partial [Streptomyces sp. NPDC005989]|uniref:hypothetical protein n=1 Tax=Streptomyces sp. NPDC005989 TaxID=3156727 RepID=UPI0033EB73A7